MTATVSDQSALRAHIDRAAGLGRYVLRNVRLHTATTRADAADAADSAFFLANMSVEKGRILAITPAPPHTTTANDPNLPYIDVGGRVTVHHPVGREPHPARAQPDERDHRVAQRHSHAPLHSPRRLDAMQRQCTRP